MSMKSSEVAKVVMMVLSLWMSLYYYVTYSDIYIYSKEKTGKLLYTGTEDFLLNTPGCIIPKYYKTMPIHETKSKHKTCGQRAVFIKRLANDKVKFIIDEKKIRTYNTGKNNSYNCCYKFVTPLITKGKIDYRKIRYSSCKPFNNQTISKLENDFITVTCTNNASHVFYNDAYAIIKKIDQVQMPSNNSWNILVVGMDTMSGARVSKSMPKTVQYFKENNWLRFKAYQKVDYNTFPNVAALLTGKNLSAVHNVCASAIDLCNKLLLWTDFKKAGYVTAYGEDFLGLPDTFSRFHGFTNKPTDHYLRPLFLTGEINVGNFVCTKKLPSTLHILDFASDFARLYREEKFYGFFWSNSYSHNIINNPTLLDGDVVDFFKKLNESSVLENTFVFFLSDHGIRFGEMRIPYESYYDERLPMLFAWVPKKFQETYSGEYKNIQISQNRLITPYDLYLTMLDILHISNETSNTLNLESCPRCSSLFKWISPFRNCQDAGVNDKWCSCYNLVKISHSHPNVKHSIELLVSHLQNKSKSILTKKCTKCALFKLRNIIRAHMYSNERENKTFYVIAVVMSPGYASYEVTIVKEQENFRILEPSHAISRYAGNGDCTVNSYDREYCVCNKIEECKNKH